MLSLPSPTYLYTDGSTSMFREIEISVWNSILQAIPDRCLLTTVAMGVQLPGYAPEVADRDRPQQKGDGGLSDTEPVAVPKRWVSMASPFLSRPAPLKYVVD